MFDDPLFVLVAVSAIIVLIILLIGIGGFAQGGEFNRKHANRIMRYRIIFQAIALIVILILIWWKRTG